MCSLFLVQEALKKGADVNKKIYQTVDIWETPLHIVVENYPGRRFEEIEEIVKVLIAAGADVNAKDSHEHTPLSYLVLHCKKSLSYHRRIINLLIRLGADININERSGRGGTALHTASFMRGKDMVELLIGAGADINSIDNRGETPLHWASQEVEVVKLLIASGADVNKKCNDGCTPIFNAVIHGSTDVIELLIDSGADVNIRDKNGMTAFDHAR